MNNELKELVLLAMQAEYDKQILFRIIDILKSIFKTNYVAFNVENDNCLKKDNLLYLPISINKKIYAYYEIENNNSKIDRSMLEFITLILSQMYTNNWINYRKNNSDIDYLTNVYNRNSFEKFKKMYLPSNTIISCVFIDVNGLNKINNMYGHAMGDKAICSVANVLNNTFDNGKVYRIGGDEFVVIIFGADEYAVYKKTHEVKEILKNCEIYISAGINIGKNIVDIEDFIKIADHKMYEDKKNFYKSIGENWRKK